MNGCQQIVGGLLAYCFSLIPEGSAIKSWQAIFIAYGCISLCWGFFVGWWMPDSPMRAKCFSEEDKHLIIERVRDNQTGLQNRVFRKEQMIEAFKDPQTWCYCLIAVSLNSWSEKELAEDLNVNIFCVIDLHHPSNQWPRRLRKHRHQESQLQYSASPASLHGPRSM
jgi:hypothetical protein